MAFAKKEHANVTKDMKAKIVRNCGRYGTCVGPNYCRCRLGWKVRYKCIIYIESDIETGILRN